MDQPQQALIVALDVPSLDEAERLAEKVARHVGWFKIGLELFSRVGPKCVEKLSEMAPIMLDLKLHDIPATVARAARALSELEVGMLTVHAAGGEEMLRQAAAAAPSVKLLAVTVLTSLDKSALSRVGVDEDLEGVVRKRAVLARDNGCAGVVASPIEAPSLRVALGDGPLIVTPGIRLSDSTTDDQKRIATPRSAIASGADYIVVGRPIRDASDPARAARAISREIAAGLEARVRGDG